MIRYMSRVTFGKDDPLNHQRLRSLRNTSKFAFNCGGYALGTFSWYCPHTEAEDRGWLGHDYSFDTSEEAIRKTNHYVDVMLADFPGRLRVIHALSELKLTEYAIAFRIGSDGDFHYMRRGFNGRWYHKRGSNPDILTISEAEVLYTEWCNGKYDGPIVLLAMKK